MAAWTIALPTAANPRVTQSVELEGQSFVFGIRWNQRSNRWTVSLTTASGTPVVRSMLLCIGLDMLRTVPPSDDTPKGQLYLGGIDDPTLTTTGDVTLFYVDGAT